MAETDQGHTEEECVDEEQQQPVPLCEIRKWSDDVARYAAEAVVHSGRAISQEINNLVSFLQRVDCTILQIDAIVNAANTGLWPGGGICGAIHDAAGPELQEECRRIGGCPVGHAVRTRGYKLPAKYVIHAVGPVGEREEELASAYRSILDLVDGNEVRSVCLCCISTGIFGYPIIPATDVACRTVRDWLEVEANRTKVDRIIFGVFTPRDCAVYQRALVYYFPADVRGVMVVGGQAHRVAEGPERSGREPAGWVSRGIPWAAGFDLEGNAISQPHDRRSEDALLNEPPANEGGTSGCCCACA